jgi:hypothetical protein
MVASWDVTPLSGASAPSLDSAADHGIGTIDQSATMALRGYA